MSRNLSNQDISWFLDLHDKKQLNLDPPYQRKSVWSPSDKRFFIDTILNNYPAPPVFLHKTLDESGRPTYHVVDGKQRLQTIIDFQKGRIMVPESFSDPALCKKKWKDLDRSARERFWNYTLIVEMLPEVNDGYVKNIFERINRNSRKLMPQELRHAKYDGWFVTKAELEADKQEWKEFGVVTTARAKRMADVQFISELMALMIMGGPQGFDQDLLNDIYAQYDDLADLPAFVEEDFLSCFEGLKSKVRDVLAFNPDLAGFLKVQNNFYSLWGLLFNESHRITDLSSFSGSYFGFLQGVADYLENGVRIGEWEGPAEYQKSIVVYANNLRGASTELPQRQARHAALLSGVLKEPFIEAFSDED